MKTTRRNFLASIPVLGALCALKSDSLKEELVEYPIYYSTSENNGKFRKITVYLCNEDGTTDHQIYVMEDLIDPSNSIPCPTN